MSALGQLFASLWAGMWLRWRVLEMRAQRLFAGVPSVDEGPDFHLAAAGAPVEGVDYEPIELPADLTVRLDAMRGELVDQARAATTRRVPRRGVRRRRVASLVVAAFLTLAVLGAGATALMTGSTGIPAIDRMLGYNAATRDQGNDGGRASRPSREAVTPRLGTDSLTLIAPYEIDGRAQEVVGTSYRSEDGSLCLATTSDDLDAPTPQGSGTCLSLRTLRRQIRDRFVVVSSVQVNETTVLGGYASSDVAHIEIEGPGGALTVKLSEPWRPDGSGGEALRSFLAVLPKGFGPGRNDPDVVDRAIDPSEYSIRSRLLDGVSIKPQP
jgi:hypothetical protein